MNRIRDLVNEWDPIGLFPMAPEDEYDNEIRKIETFIHANDSIDIEALANEIDEIFKRAFGEDMYNARRDACKSLAQKILEASDNAEL